MKNLIAKFIKDESGATMVEYAILVALIAVVAIGALVTVGDQLIDTFGAAVDSMQNPTGTTEG